MILYIIMVDTHHEAFFKPIECTPPRVNTSVNYIHWMIMMCQCSFISCNKCTTLVGDVVSEGACACVGAGGTWETSVPPLNFAVNRMLLKKKYILLQRKKKKTM